MNTVENLSQQINYSVNAQQNYSPDLGKSQRFQSVDKNNIKKQEISTNANTHEKINEKIK